MKNLLLLACFICCGVSAQQYHPLLDSVQNRWTYATQFVGLQPNSLTSSNCNLQILPDIETSPVEYTSGDSVLNSQLYHKLYRIGNPLIAACLLGLIREDTAQQQVWFVTANDTIEHILYDFTLNSGDSIYLYNPIFSGQQGYYHVDSTGTTLINNLQHKTISISHPASGVSYKWVEGIGSLEELLYWRIVNPQFGNVFTQCAGFQHTKFQFLNCFEQQQKVYFDTCAYQLAQLLSGGGMVVIDSCNYYYFVSSVYTNENTLSLKLFPNPAGQNTVLEVKINFADNYKLIITDFSGRMISSSSHRFGIGNQRIDISTANFSDGVYFVMLASESGSSRTKLMIKH